MNLSREHSRSHWDAVQDAIGAKVDAGELVPAEVHEAMLEDLSSRLTHAQDVIDRITAANDKLMRHVEAARGRIRELDDENESLRAQLRRRDHGRNDTSNDREPGSRPL
ncbi:MAG: hypothetical protein M3N57_12890 [Actinomycetota bacterium]|nr:hypothetical protein [Actinomycetota bacterium]